MKRKLTITGSILCFLFFTQVLLASRPAPTPAPEPEPIEDTAPLTGDCFGNDNFQIGRGVYDITGPAAEVGMMGYAVLSQKTEGIHQRLRARAFVVKSPCNGERVVFVSADLGQVFQGVTQGVIKKLAPLYGNLYHERNMMLSATHTHSGPGGYSHYALYNLTILGYDEQGYEAIVNGIYQAIVRAHNNMVDGTIKIATGDLDNASVNRSLTAYNNNPSSERSQYSDDVDKRMTVLKFQSLSGTQLGMINWFGVHNTSISNKNKKISGDNKGYASWLFEKAKSTNYSSSNTFVAAFAQSNEGDVSPNVPGFKNGMNGGNDYENAATSGTKQYNKAVSLYNSASTTLAGGVDYRHSNVNFAGRTVGSQWAGGITRKTCSAWIGISFAAGAEDGPSDMPWIEEGMAYDGASWPNFTLAPEAQACHDQKIILLPTGSMSPPWTPEVLPVQIMTIGNLALVGVPFECTTMCGRRIRNTVQAQLSSSGIDHVVIAGLSNAYAGYVATKEEYDLQHYEGASTHFGPWTLAAFEQEFNTLAVSLRDDTSVSAGPTPRDLVNDQSSLQTGVVFDDIPLFKNFGDVDSNANSSYSRGNTVNVRFWSGHPKNNLKTQGSYLAVQRSVNGSWQTVANDWDHETFYKWERSGVANSKVTVTWNIPSNAATGTYRIRHWGHWKSGWDGSINGYSGTSRNFTVN